MIARYGDIVEFDFNPSLGSEPSMRRPALVVSTDEFNLGTSMTLVCPITSINNGFPLHIELPDDLSTDGYVVSEQVRAFDLSARNPSFVEHIERSSNFMVNIRKLITSFF